MDGNTKVAVKIAGDFLLGKTLTNFLIEKVEASSNAADEAAKKDIGSLNHEAACQRIEMELALQHSRIAQELAIAQRIENAADVEIEEYYDTLTKGQGGLNVDADSRTASLGASGEHSRVTKRVYKFKGFKRVPDLETIEQDLS